jgi:eukaryotic-like serine/threonine-protein kinase
MGFLDMTRMWYTFTKIMFVTWLVFFGCSGWKIRQFSVRPDRDWVMGSRDPMRTSNAPGGIRLPLKLLWKYDASAATGSPVAADSLVFIGTYRGELYAVNSARGEKMGRLSLEGPIHGTPVVDDSMIFVVLSSGGNTLVAIDIRSGDIVWKNALGPIETSPVQYGGHLFIAALDGLVYCFQKDTGEELWKYSLPDSKKGRNIHSSPATDGTILVFGCDDGTVVALDVKTGELRWTAHTRASIFGSPSIGANRVIIGSTDHRVYALNVVDGSICWKSDFNGMLYSSPALSDSIAVIGAANGIIRALSLSTGSTLWEYHASSVVSAPMVVCNDVAICGTLDRFLYAFDIRTGEILWKTTVEGRIKSAPVSWGTMVFVPVEDKYIYAYTSP